MGASEVRALDNSETALWNLESDLTSDQLRCYLVDICNETHLERHFEDIDFVFHAAALKHVPFCERQPHAAIETNIRGVESVINAATSCNVRRVLFTSSDKAVNSTNLMGATKFLGERLMTSANNLSSKKDFTKFASCRFGNVAMSSGSVIPRFIDQIKNGRPLTITDREMSRFMMSIEESVGLVIDSLIQMRGGEVFVTPMPVLRIGALADVLVKNLAPKYGHKAKGYPELITGVRPGEKLFEELTTEEELPRSFMHKGLIVVVPAFRNIYDQIDYSCYESSGEELHHVYHSHNETVMTNDEIEEFLKALGVFDTEVRLADSESDLEMDIKRLDQGFSEPGQEAI
jgi:FlaA1/EpsC-like NDP-sugar epimerase